MPKQVKSTARDVFFYLLMIVTLYISVISFIALLFQFVNTLIPEAFTSFTSISYTIRTATAALFVSWPIYVFVSRVTEKDIQEAPEKLRIGVRRWLLYLTLFIAAITIIIDLIVLMNEFMGGDLTMRFFLKTFVVLLVTAGVFGHYLKALKEEVAQSKGYLRTVAVVSSIIVYGSIIAAFVIVGSPAKQRDLRFDEVRVNHLSQIQSQLTQYYQEKEVLPETLTEMSTGVAPYEPPVDPETEQVYVYEKTGDLMFNLCATFAYEDNGVQNARTFYGGQYDWEHPAGYYCFERTIDPDFFLDTKPRPSETIVY